MNTRCLIFLLAPLYTVQAAQWEPSLASTASLRTGGAVLVSSDALNLSDGQHALITYWEARSSDDLDFYRCIDVVDAGFSTVSQECWSALRPSGRGPSVVDGVRASNDLCGRPDDLGGLSSAAFCSFTETMVVQTPAFRVAVAPFEGGGSVAVGEDGRYLLVTDQAWPTSVFFEVRANRLAAHPRLAGVSTTAEVVTLEDDAIRCEAQTIVARQWAACQSTSVPNTRVHYSIEQDFVYEVSYSQDATPADQQAIDSMFGSLSFRPQ